MANVSKEKLIGSIMPDAYIDSVILETAGGEWPDLRVQNDRLAAHVQEIDFAQTSQRYRQRVENNLQTPQKSLKISVSILLKDLLAKDASTSWFFKNNFVNFLSYVVVVSTNKSVTSTLLQLDDSEDRSIFLGGVGEGVPQRRDLWGEILRLNLKKQRVGAGVKRLIDTNLDAKMGRVQIPQDDNNREKPYTETDSTGKQLYNFFFTESFDYPQVEIDHLTVFAYTIFDIDAYFDSLNVNGQIRNRLKKIADKTVSLLRVNTVIDRSKVVSDSVILRFVDNDEIWTGPYHVMGDGTYMSGRFHNPNRPGRTLYSELVPNNVVQDFRNFEEFRPNIVDLSSLQEDVLPSMSRLFRDHVKNSLDVGEKLNYFSDILMSRGLEGQCEFVFAMDLNKVCKKNTKYPKVVAKNLDLLDSHFKIQSFKILRRRVEEIKKPLGNQSPGDTSNSPNSKSLVIFEGGEYNKSIGAKTSSDTVLDIPDEIISTESGINNNIRARQGKNSIRELKLDKRPSAPRTYSVSDGSIIDFVKGKYQYGIEIKIQDLVAEHISEYLGKLLGSRNMLLEYLVEAQKPVNRKKRNAVGRDDPHINLAGKWEKDLRTQNLEDQGNFDVAANRFTQKFVETWRSAPWRQAGVDTTDALALLFSRENLPRGLRQSFFARACAPESGSPDGIRSVISLMDDVIVSLAKLIGTKVSQKGSATGSFPTPLGGRGGSQLQAADPQKDVFTITHFFDNDVFDASYPKDTGYYYLLRQVVDLGLEKQRRNYGVRTLSVGEFEERLSEDVSKFVTDPTGTVTAAYGAADNLVTQLRRSVNIITSDRYKYLTPSRISLGFGGSTVNLLGIGLPQGPHLLTPQEDSFNFYDTFSALAAQIANLKSPAGQPFVSIARGGNDSDSIRDNLMEVLADKGCTIGKPDDKLFFSQGAIAQAAAIPRTSTTTGRPAGRVYSVPTSPDVRSGADPDLNISEMFGADSPVTADVGSVNVGDTKSIADIIGIHTTEDTDLFNAGPVFLRLLMNVVFEDEELKRRTRRILSSDSPQSDVGIFADTFDITTITPVNTILSRLFERLPLAIKSLFLSSIPENRGDLNFSIPQDEDVLQDPLKAMVWYFNFFSTMKLEVLDQFPIITREVPVQQASAGALFPNSTTETETVKSISLKEPVWVPLTLDRVRGIGTGDLLIRMTPYRNGYLKIEQIPGLKLDTFSSYFILNETGAAFATIPRTAGAIVSRLPIRDQRAITGVLTSGRNISGGASSDTIPREYASSDPRLGIAAAQTPSATTRAKQRVIRQAQEVVGPPQAQTSPASGPPQAPAKAKAPARKAPARKAPARKAPTTRRGGGYS